jgi:hypothetical protein
MEPKKQEIVSAEQESKLKQLASGMRKVLPPKLLQEVIDHCDPLSAFLRELRGTDAKS